MGLAMSRVRNFFTPKSMKKKRNASEVNTEEDYMLASAGRFDDTTVVKWNQLNWKDVKISRSSDFEEIEQKNLRMIEDVQNKAKAENLSEPEIVSAVADMVKEYVCKKLPMTQSQANTVFSGVKSNDGADSAKKISYLYLLMDISDASANLNQDEKVSLCLLIDSLSLNCMAGAYADLFLKKLELLGSRSCETVLNSQIHRAPYISQVGSYETHVQGLITDSFGSAVNDEYSVTIPSKMSSVEAKQMIYEMAFLDKKSFEETVSRDFIKMIESAKLASRDHDGFIEKLWASISDDPNPLIQTLKECIYGLADSSEESTLYTKSGEELESDVRIIVGRASLGSKECEMQLSIRNLLTDALTHVVEKKKFPIWMQRKFEEMGGFDKVCAMVPNEEMRRQLINFRSNVEVIPDKSKNLEDYINAGCSAAEILKLLKSKKYKVVDSQKRISILSVLSNPEAETIFNALRQNRFGQPGYSIVYSPILVRECLRSCLDSYLSSESIFTILNSAINGPDRQNGDIEKSVFGMSQLKSIIQYMSVNPNLAGLIMVAIGKQFMLNLYELSAEDWKYVCGKSSAFESLKELLIIIGSDHHAKGYNIANFMSSYAFNQLSESALEGSAEDLYDALDIAILKMEKSQLIQVLESKKSLFKCLLNNLLISDPSKFSKLSIDLIGKMSPIDIQSLLNMRNGRDSSIYFMMQSDIDVATASLKLFIDQSSQSSINKLLNPKNTVLKNSLSFESFKDPEKAFEFWKLIPRDPENIYLHMGKISSLSYMVGESNKSLIGCLVCSPIGDEFLKHLIDGCSQSQILDILKAMHCMPDNKKIIESLAKNSYLAKNAFKDMTQQKALEYLKDDIIGGGSSTENNALLIDIGYYGSHLFAEMSPEEAKSLSTRQSLFVLRSLSNSQDSSRREHINEICDILSLNISQSDAVNLLCESGMSDHGLNSINPKTLLSLFKKALESDERNEEIIKLLTGQEQGGLMFRMSNKDLFFEIWNEALNRLKADELRDLLLREFSTKKGKSKLIYQLFLNDNEKFDECWKNIVKIIGSDSATIVIDSLSGNWSLKELEVKQSSEYFPKFVVPLIKHLDPKHRISALTKENREGESILFYILKKGKVSCEDMISFVESMDEENGVVSILCAFADVGRRSMLSEATEEGKKHICNKFQELKEYQQFEVLTKNADMSTEMFNQGFQTANIADLFMKSKDALSKDKLRDTLMLAPRSVVNGAENCHNALIIANAAGSCSDPKMAIKDLWESLSSFKDKASLEIIMEDTDKELNSVPWAIANLDPDYFVKSVLPVMFERMDTANVNRILDSRPNSERQSMRKKLIEFGMEDSIVQAVSKSKKRKSGYRDSMIRRNPSFRSGGSRNQNRASSNVMSM